MSFECMAVDLPQRQPSGCSIAGCLNPLRARSYCSTHWARWRKTGDPNFVNVFHLPEICAYRGCHRRPAGRLDGSGDAYCNLHYQRLRTGGTPDRPEKMEYRTCQAPDCGRRARSTFGKWCDKHYGRLRVNGTLDLKVTPRKAGGLTDAGYVWVLDPTHPLAKGGRVYLHRKVLYDLIGPGPHQCRWCERDVTWGGMRDGGLVADHLDGDKSNNEPENLVPACNPCNTLRGMFMVWGARHADDPYFKLIFPAA